MIHELLSKLPPERRPAEIARIRRNVMLRRVQLEAVSRGAPLPYCDLRRLTAPLVEQLPPSTGRNVQRPAARAWRQTDIEMQLELLVQTLEDRIAELPTIEDLRRCYVDGLNQTPAVEAYTEPLQHEVDQLVRIQRRLLATLSPARQEELLRRLASAYLLHLRTFTEH